MPAIDLDTIGAIDSDGESPDVLRAYVLDRRRSARWALDAELLQTLEGAGFDAPDLCSRELTARIADLNICELLQTIANGRKDATIDLFHGSLVSRIWCKEGQIVDAVSGRLASEPAVYRILAVDQGELVADFRPVRRRQAVASSTLTLMLEASRRKDECAVLERRLGGIQHAYRAAASRREVAEAERLEATLLRAFEGGARIETVLANGELDDLTMLQEIARLVERGALVATDAPPQALVLLKPPAPTPPVPTANAQGAFPFLARRRRREAWRSVAAFAGASVALALLGLLLRANRADVPIGTLEPSERHETEQTLALEPEASTAPPGPARGSRGASMDDATAADYQVQVIAEPASAELCLDGTWTATGELSIVLGRTGQTHELRIAAPGYQPRTLLFRDTPPPLGVRLLPATHPGSTEGASGLSPTPPATPTARTSSRPAG